ncbi:MAG: UbiX family flavin prenyltransferase [Planctomycetota bacterium]|nr:MAG: UbiX family flavin prenyltransferase [Planctomycetota bacterium]
MNATAGERRLIVGITGASGAAYARRLLQCLADAGVFTHVVVSDHGRRLLAEELGITTLRTDSLLGRAYDGLMIHPFRDVGAEIASGSFRTMGMVICPCSSHTLAAVAAGLGDNLLQRAAQVTLKEGRRLVLVTREMPMSRLDLLNALRLTECGAVICPASPGFYLAPQTIDDLIDFVVGKVLDLFDIPHELKTRWADHLAQQNCPPDRPEA